MHPPDIINQALGGDALVQVARILDALLARGWSFVHLESLKTPLDEQLTGLARIEATRLLGVGFAMPDDDETTRDVAYVEGIDEAVATVLRLAPGALPAWVAHVRPSLRQSGRNVTLEFHDEAHADRLYDAIEQFLDATQDVSRRANEGARS